MEVVVAGGEFWDPEESSLDKVEIFSITTMKWRDGMSVENFHTR